MMDVYDLMMVMISGGIALCSAYIRAQYVDWRNQQTAEVEKTIRVRLLYPVELSRPQEGVVVLLLTLQASVRILRFPRLLKRGREANPCLREMPHSLRRLRISTVAIAAPCNTAPSERIDGTHGRDDSDPSLGQRVCHPLHCIFDRPLRATKHGLSQFDGAIRVGRLRVNHRRQS
jgi:hypothetical protein